MWSGPRNLSTALMRSFGNRPDSVGGGRAAVRALPRRHRAGPSGPRTRCMAASRRHWPDVVAHRWTAADGDRVQYQKHMTHHLLPEVDRARLAGLRHAYLIRDPARRARLLRQGPRRADPGRPRASSSRWRFPAVRRAGGRRRRPAARAAAGRWRRSARRSIRFDPAMLSWPRRAAATPTGCGPRTGTRGSWASTGFAADRECGGGMPELPRELERLAARCQPYYEELAAAAAPD